MIGFFKELVEFSGLERVISERFHPNTVIPANLTGYGLWTSLHHNLFLSDELENSLIV